MKKNKSVLKELFSLLFGKADSAAKPLVPVNWVLCVSVHDPLKLSTYQENLRSHAIEFEVRGRTDLFVPENELETARAVIAEGQWEY